MSLGCDAVVDQFLLFVLDEGVSGCCACIDHGDSSSVCGKRAAQASVSSVLPQVRQADDGGCTQSRYRECGCLTTRSSIHRNSSCVKFCLFSPCWLHCRHSQGWPAQKAASKARRSEGLRVTWQAIMGWWVQLRVARSSTIGKKCETRKKRLFPQSRRRGLKSLRRTLPGNNVPNRADRISRIKSASHWWVRCSSTEPTLRPRKRSRCRHRGLVHGRRDLPSTEFFRACCPLISQPPSRVDRRA